MILGILLGLLSFMLLISLGISVFIYVKFSEIQMKLEGFKSQMNVLNMFKEQTLVELIQIKSGAALSQINPNDILDPNIVKKINDDQDLAFEEEYLKALEARGL